MNFATALISMQQGCKVSREHWSGYWDVENKNEIMIHCRDGRVFNLRNTEDMLYTMSNIACDDWKIISDEEAAKIDSLNKG